MASVLWSFSFLTQMHERYAYGALVFLLLLIPDRRPLVRAIASRSSSRSNLLAAVPPTPELEAPCRSPEPLGIVGSVAMVALSVLSLLWLRRDAADGPRLSRWPRP